MALKKEKYNYEFEIMKHKKLVSDIIHRMTFNLLLRAERHDDSKFAEPEFSVFKKHHPALRAEKYMSEKYNKILKKMKIGVDHHQKHNDHHPEFHRLGVSDMSIFAIMEMLADWASAQHKQNGGELSLSQLEHCIRTNCKRYDISEDIAQMLLNSVPEMTDKSDGSGW